MSSTLIQDVSNIAPRPFLHNLAIPTPRRNLLAATPVSTPSSSANIVEIAEVEISRSSISLFLPQKAATSYDYIGGNLVWLASKISRFFTGFWAHRGLDKLPQEQLAALVKAYKAKDWARIDTCIAKLNSHEDNFLFQKEHFYAIEYALGRTLFARILLHEIKIDPIKEASGFGSIWALLQAKYGEGFHEPTITPRDIFEPSFLSLLSRQSYDNIIKDALLIEIAWEDLSFEFDVALHPHQNENTILPAAYDVADDLLALGYPKQVLAYVLAQHSEYILKRIENKHPSTSIPFFANFCSRIIESCSGEDALNDKELNFFMNIISYTNTAYALTSSYQKKLSSDIAQLGVTDQVTGRKEISTELASQLVRKINSEIMEELDSQANRAIAAGLFEKKNISTEYREALVHRLQNEARKNVLNKIKIAFEKETTPCRSLINALDLFLKKYDEYEQLRETLLFDLDAHSTLTQNKALELLQTKNKDANFCSKVYQEVLVDAAPRIKSAIGQTSYTARLKEIGLSSASLEQLGFATMSARISG